MRTSPLLADFIQARGCKPKCEKSLTLPSSKHLKSPKSLEIRAFRQKESTAILIPIVSKLRCFFAE